VGVCPESFGYDLQHASGVQQNVIVPEAKNAPALSNQISVALCIALRMSVLAAIGFDNEPSFNGSEIDYIGWDRKLPAKTRTELMTTKLSPKCAFGIGQAGSKPARLKFDPSTATHIDAAWPYDPHPNPPPLAREGIQSH
jgi:hypothetical protein